MKITALDGLLVFIPQSQEQILNVSEIQALGLPQNTVLEYCGRDTSDSDVYSTVALFFKLNGLPIKIAVNFDLDPDSYFYLYCAWKSMQ